MISPAILACAPSGSNSNYVGPLDLVPGAVVAYSQRAMSAEKRGSAVYTIRRDSNDATQAFSSNAVTGSVDAAAIAAFIGGGAGFVGTWNDQSGNASDGVQATAGQQPTWAAAQFGGVSALTFDGVARLLQAAGAVTLASGGINVFLVVNATVPTNPDASGYNYFTGMNTQLGTGNGSEFSVNFVDNSDGTSFVKYDSTSDAYDTNEAGGLSITPPSNSLLYGAPAVIDWSFDTGFSSFRFNNVDIPMDHSNDFGTLGTLAFVLSIGGADTIASGLVPMVGQMAELIIYAGGLLSDPNRLAIRQNIAAYYGITLS